MYGLTFGLFLCPSLIRTLTFSCVWIVYYLLLSLIAEIMFKTFSVLS